MRKVSKLSYLGACFKSGQPIKGVEFGPQSIRDSGIFQGLKENYDVTVNDHGDVQQVQDSKQIHKSHIKNLNVLDSSLEKLNNRVTQIIKNVNDNEEVMLTVGGDHSIASGTIHALLGKYPDLKVIWVDAHGDMIDASKSTYDGYHGMPLSHLLGVNDSHIPGFKWLTRRLKPENIVHIGLRDIDTDQWDTIARLKIKCFTPDHIDMLGIGQVMRQTFQYLDPSNGSKDHKSAPFHISFDIDALDPLHSQATGTMYRGGLSYRQACHIVRRTSWQRKLVSMDLVEINPMIEQGTRKKYRGEEKYAENLKLTVGMGVDLIDSIFKRYLSL